jgi:signal transduction histidine kinase
LELLWQPLHDMKVFVNIDRYKMSQVIRNVVSNALKFSEPGQKIIVGAEFVTAKASPKAKNRTQNYSITTASEDLENQSHAGQRLELESQQPTAAGSASSSFIHTLTCGMRGSMSSFLKIWNEEDDDDDGSIVDRPVTTSSAASYHSKAGSTKKTDMIRIFVTDFGPGISKVKLIFVQIDKFIEKIFLL